MWVLPQELARKWTVIQPKFFCCSLFSSAGTHFCALPAENPIPSHPWWAKKGTVRGKEIMPPLSLVERKGCSNHFQYYLRYYQPAKHMDYWEQHFESYHGGFGLREYSQAANSYIAHITDSTGEKEVCASQGTTKTKWSHWTWIPWPYLTTLIFTSDRWLNEGPKAAYFVKYFLSFEK